MKTMFAVTAFAMLCALGVAACDNATAPEDVAPAVPSGTPAFQQAGAPGKIVPGGPYNLRSGPGTNYAIVDKIASGTQVSILCTAEGTTHTGPYGTTKIWDKLSSGKWITDAYVYTGTNGRAAPDCSAAPAPQPPVSSGFKLPLPGNLKWQVTAGIGKGCGGVSHHGESFGIADCYAVDFVESGRSNVSVLAAAGGKIVTAVWNVPNPSKPNCNSSNANRVVIDHGNGIYTQYWHLKYNSVPEHLRKNGATVQQGERLGTMGNTGCIITSPGRTGIHLHFRLNSGSTTGTKPELKDMLIDGVRLRDFTAGREYQSSNAR